MALLNAKDFSNSGVTPIGADKHGPMFSRDGVEKVIVGMINSDQYFNQQAKNMTSDAEKAIGLTEDVNARFSKTLDNFQSTTKKFTEQAKTASGGVRDAADKLANGLLKIEKAANFDKLERYVELLERAAKAMEVLAELEKSGKLDKIAGALR